MTPLADAIGVVLRSTVHLANQAPPWLECRGRLPSAKVVQGLELKTVPLVWGRWSNRQIFYGQTARVSLRLSLVVANRVAGSVIIKAAVVVQACP